MAVLYTDGDHATLCFEMPGRIGVRHVGSWDLRLGPWDLGTRRSTRMTGAMRGYDVANLAKKRTLLSPEAKQGKGSVRNLSAHSRVWNRRSSLDPFEGVEGAWQRPREAKHQ